MLWLPIVKHVIGVKQLNASASAKLFMGTVAMAVLPSLKVTFPVGNPAPLEAATVPSKTMMLFGSPYGTADSGGGVPPFTLNTVALSDTELFSFATLTGIPAESLAAKTPSPG